MSCNILVSSYNKFNILAHKPSGNESDYSNIVASEGELLGDVNQDSAIDVLDIINVVYFILELDNPYICIK